MPLKKNFSLCKSALIFAGCILFFSCNSENEYADSNTEGDKDTVVMEETAPAATVSYMLPSPLQIAAIFKKSGLKYIDGISNPVSNNVKYTSNMSKNLNLGIYSSDLCYTVLNKQNQASINYIKTVKQLVDQLGMTSIFEVNNLSSRFEKNLGNEDSLALIIAELQMETDLFLEDNEKQHMSSIVFAGAWIESMYIGSQVYLKTKNGPVGGKIAEQMTILESIIKVLKSYEKKETEITNIVADLESIKNNYDNFSSVKAAKPHTDDDEVPEITLSEDEISLLSKQLAEVRNKIVNA